MIDFPSKVLSAEKLSKDVIKLQLEKPKDYTYTSGLSIDLRYNNLPYEQERKPLTLTSNPEDPYLEVMCKQYPEKGGLSVLINQFKGGEEVFISKAFGKYKYRGEGTFIAMGIGITPFVSILRSLKRQNAIGNNKLIISNKTSQDVVIKQEFEQLLGNNAHFVLTREQKQGYTSGRINPEMLKSFTINMDGEFYVCGSTEFKKGIKEMLLGMGVKPEKILA
jgi:propane monooxygenase reductase component